MRTCRNALHKPPPWMAKRFLTASQSMSKTDAVAQIGLGRSKTLPEPDLRRVYKL